jgi:hypothetical protein
MVYMTEDLLKHSLPNLHHVNRQNPRHWMGWLSANGKVPDDWHHGSSSDVWM